MKNKLTTAIILPMVLTACVNSMNSGNRPLLFEETLTGSHTTLAHCVVKNLYADTRPFMQLYHYKIQRYPAIRTVQIFAYDTRFLPYIYPSNSPQNPDGVRDYISVEPEVLPDVQQVLEAEYPHAFELTINEHDNTSSVAAIKGNRYVGEIAWNYLRTCATAEFSFFVKPLNAN